MTSIAHVETARPLLLRIAPRLTISLVLLCWIALIVPVHPLLASFGRVRPWLLLASYLTIPLIVYIDANRTRVLTAVQGMTHTVGTLWRISLVSSFYSMLLPGLAAGGVVRWHRLARRDAMPGQALAVVMFGRTLSTAITVSVGLACAAMDPIVRGHPIWGGTLALIAVGLIAFIWMAFLTDRAAALVLMLSQRGSLSPFIRGHLCRLAEHAGAFRSLGWMRLTATLLLMLANELIALASFYLLALALNLPLSAFAVGWTRAYVLMVTILPISILGIGVREGSLIAMLSVYHIDPASAVVYSTLILGRNVLTGILGAGIELGSLMWGRSAKTSCADSSGLT